MAGPGVEGGGGAGLAPDAPAASHDTAGSNHLYPAPPRRVRGERRHLPGQCALVGRARLAALVVGALSSVPVRCGARTRAGCGCRAPAMANGRCRMHGGASTGPRTEEGRARLRAAHMTHGGYGAETQAVLRCSAAFVAETRALMAELRPAGPGKRAGGAKAAPA
jgi:hypothetical protein